MAAMSEGERVALARKASLVAAGLVAERVDAYVQKYGEAFTQALQVLAGAKQRCTNPNSIGYSNYGGRGITFDFPSVRSAAEWILDNLGERPTDAHSLDRIDNNQGYKAGNLRWATREEQARNKRAYNRTQNGERIRKLKELRPDLTYETIRLWITQGATDEEILGRKKYARPSV
jgi:hypothetical protein